MQIKVTIEQYAKFGCKYCDAEFDGGLSYVSRKALAHIILHHPIQMVKHTVDIVRKRKNGDKEVKFRED